MASTKREFQPEDEPESEQPESKRIRSDADGSDSPKTQPCRNSVVLNHADCNLDFDIGNAGLKGSALHEEGLLIAGLVLVQILESLGESIVLVVKSSQLSLLIWKTHPKISSMSVVLILKGNHWLLGFSKNGKWLGIAKEFDAGPRGFGVVDSAMKELQWESALFPHVLLKNVVVQLHFSAEDGLVPEEGDCEVMMMVGLPASGKTTWADKWVKEHPEKRYVLLGTNLILDQMKVPGLVRKNNYGERFDRLMSRANAIFDILLSRAARTPRNYVIDQTNVFKSARKRKLRPFANFRKVAVVVFPKPEEQKFRADKRYKEMGKEVPADAVNNMLANYVLPKSKDMPGSDEFFDQVIFAELGQVESQRYLEEMKHGLNTNSAPYYEETFVASSVGQPSVQNQGVVGGHWESSHPPPALGLPHLLNYGYRITNQQEKTLHQGQGSFSRAHQSYQYPSVPRAPAPYSSYESFVPPHNGNSGSSGAIPGCRNNPYQSYGAVDPYSRRNLNVKNTTFDPYRSTVVEASPVGTMRPSSFTYNTAGGPQSVRAPIAPSYGPGACPPYGSHYGTNPRPMSSFSTPSPRPSNGNFPGVVQHPEDITLLVQALIRVEIMSYISSSNPIFSCVITLYTLILFYFPQALKIFLSPVLIVTALLILFLLRLGSIQSRNPEKNENEENIERKENGDGNFVEAEKFGFLAKVDKWVSFQDETGPYPNPKPDFEESFVEWDVRAPLEVIFEAYEGEDDNEKHQDSDDHTRSAALQRCPSLSMYYPETDSDTSSDGGYSVNGEWDSPESVCFRWEDEIEQAY
ncbi:hypothetical protein GH714_018411 [Hevea brasiliensis]|uniref:Uncharacterized protein n=1 Tax=Hevea brasiliensis TaxID=3981 RepID=A0A6A6LTT1_HEVBR|nr:hypothetical protein GH714_018411 [Hevea brasiliensis]